MAAIHISALAQINTDTSENWHEYNSIVPKGLLLHESDTGKNKIGDGVSEYRSLPYIEDSTIKIKNVDIKEIPENRLVSLSYIENGVYCVKNINSVLDVPFIFTSIKINIGETIDVNDDDRLIESNIIGGLTDTVHHVYYNSNGSLSAIDTGSVIVGKTVQSTGYVFLQLKRTVMFRTLNRKQIAQWTYPVYIDKIYIDAGYVQRQAPKFIKEFENISEICWFDVVAENINFTNLRFKTITELSNFLVSIDLNNNILYPLTVTVYTYHIKKKNRKLWTYNSFYSKLQTGGYYKNNTGKLLHVIGEMPRHRVPDEVMKIIYGEYFKINTFTDEILDNMINTITVPRYERIYNSLGFNTKGLHYGEIGDMTPGRLAYDSVNKIFVPWEVAFTSGIVHNGDNIHIVADSDNVLSVYNDIKDRDILSQLSIIKVYHLVDNLNTPRYHAFNIRPHGGIDTLVIPRLEIDFGDPNPKYKVYGSFKSQITQSSVHYLNTGILIGNNGEREFIRLDKSMWGPPVSSSNKMQKSKYPKLNMFIGETQSGICTEYYPTVTLERYRGSVRWMLL